MLQPLAQLPEHIIQTIAPFTGPLPWQNIDLRVQRIPQGTVAPVHVVLAFNACHPHYPMALTAVSMTIGTDIFIDPAFADFNTAAGLSLLVHEAVHVRQFTTIPNFLVLYNQAEQWVPADRPWENPYELEAYMLECEAWHTFVADGVPRGNWVPLGIAVGFCNAAGPEMLTLW